MRFRPNIVLASWTGLLTTIYALSIPRSTVEKDTACPEIRRRFVENGNGNYSHEALSTPLSHVQILSLSRANWPSNA